MKCVVYTRVSTEEQNPEGQLQVVLDYCREKGYEVVEKFEENISGAVDPFDRPRFKRMLEYVKENGVEVVVMYDLTRFYRAPSPTEALNRLRRLVEEYGVLVDFAREPVIEDPLMRELWMFLKSWFASYERLQTGLRTRYGLMRVKREGRLYHRPGIVHYFAAVVYNKRLGELRPEEVAAAERQLVSIVERYWCDPRYKKTMISEVMEEREPIIRELYIRFPKAPRSYMTWLRLLEKNGKKVGRRAQASKPR